MPEFEKKKRRSISDRELYEEYYGVDRKKSPKKSSPQKKSGKTAKKGGGGKPSKPQKRENPPISAERQRVKEMYPEENAVRSEKKASGGKKSASSRKKSVPAGKRGSSGSKAAAQRKRKKHGSYILYYFMCGIVAAAVVTVLSVTVLFNISVFEVVGETSYTEEEIIAACGIAEGDNLLRIDIGSAEKKIVSELVYIDTAKIRRGFPNRLIIQTEPAVPAASFIVSGKYYLVSEIGRLLEITDKPSGCPVVKGYTLDPEKESNPETQTKVGGQLEDDGEKRIAAARNIITLMEQYGLTEEYTVDVTDTLNIIISYDGRIEMELGTSAAMDSKIYNASLLIKEKIAENEKCVLILTNPNRVPVRPIRDGETIDDSYVVTEKTEDTSAAETAPEL